MIKRPALNPGASGAHRTTALLKNQRQNVEREVALAGGIRGLEKVFPKCWGL